MSSYNVSKTLAEMRANKALVHHITNWVTINDCAQITRHWGCLPVMAHARDEVEEMASIAGAVALNIGTLTPDLVDAMIIAARAANHKGVPVILDAVGVGATKLRTEQARRILKETRIDIVKGNAGEIASLAGIEAEVRGVESISIGGDIKFIAKSLSATLKNIVAVTGETDIVSDGDKVLTINSGHPIMGQVVGTGCISTSTVACFATVGKNYLGQTAQALAAFGLAGERAAKDCRGPGDFLPALFNSIVKMASEAPDIKVEVKEN